MTDSTGGRLRWYVPDAFLPADSSHGVISHESACLLNTTERDARLRFTFFFQDREPIGPVELKLEARRTWHVGLNDPSALGGLELPLGVPFAYSVESDVPVVLQHSRLDTSADAYTLFTTIAYGE
ncbi:MAG TPA: sensory rhodopsin transducer [Gaiellaceae bacterium]